jgi:hypothetical protein
MSRALYPSLEQGNSDSYKMKLRNKTLTDLAEMICGSSGGGSFGAGYERENFRYRSSSYLTEFFENCDMDHRHDGSTRKYWVIEVLEEINSSAASDPQLPPDGIVRVIQELMDPADFEAEKLDRDAALKHLNTCLRRDGIQAYFDDTGRCQIRNDGSSVTFANVQIQRRRWTHEERVKRREFSNYLHNISEDELIEKILVPLFNNLGFTRVSVAGHKDKILEYGIDIWMKYQLPTHHCIYFGVQAKKGKIDAAGRSKNANIGEILNQINMMLNHLVCDPETNSKNLLDHIFIVSAGEITKQAKNMLGERLDIENRRQILFMDRDDILDLVITANLKLPEDEQNTIEPEDEFPF